MMKHSLGVKWVNGVYTKGGIWKLFNAQPTTSWEMKKLCSLKDTWKQWVFCDAYSTKEVYMETFKLLPKVKWNNIV